jgi:hypothetical protein
LIAYWGQGATPGCILCHHSLFAHSYLRQSITVVLNLY